MPFFSSAFAAFACGRDAGRPLLERSTFLEVERAAQPPSRCHVNPSIDRSNSRSVSFSIFFGYNARAIAVATSDSAPRVMRVSISAERNRAAAEKAKRGFFGFTDRRRVWGQDGPRAPEPPWFHPGRNFLNSPVAPQTPRLPIFPVPVMGTGRRRYRLRRELCGGFDTRRLLRLTGPVPCLCRWQLLRLAHGDWPIEAWRLKHATS
jgi:hypothetical protein